MSINAYRVIWRPCPVDQTVCIHLSQSHRALINHMSPSCLLLNRIILTVAYLTQTLSPLEAANPKRKQPSKYFFIHLSSSWVVLEPVPSMSVHITFAHSLSLLHLDERTLLASSPFVPRRSTSPPLSEGAGVKDKVTEGQGTWSARWLCEGSDWARKSTDERRGADWETCLKKLKKALMKWATVRPLLFTN